MPFRVLHRSRTRSRRVVHFASTLVAAAFTIALVGFTGMRSAEWSPREVEVIRSMWIGSAGNLPRDPSNRFADDSAASEFGKALFFDRRLSTVGISCGDCHEPGRVFQDGTPLGHGAGTTARRTMPIASTAYSSWFFWDGRADSQWSQALGPLESSVEHAGTRSLYARFIVREYGRQYAAIFGAPPSLGSIPEAGGPLGTAAERATWNTLSRATQDSITRVFVNIGKAIAAFERRVQYRESRFDRYAARVAGAEPQTSAELSPTEALGLRLFIGKGNCVSCHSGPMLTDFSFHNVGVSGTVDARPDSGRKTGLDQLYASEFNCLGAYSDARPQDCALSKVDPSRNDGTVQAFRTPSLRALPRRAPYGHTGEFATLAAILDHHNRAPNGTAGTTELKPLGLTRVELDAIEAFLRTLDSRAVVEGGTPLVRGPR